MPGVVAVITAAELEGAVFPVQVPAEIPNYLRPVFHALADDKVRYAGDPVALSSPRAATWPRMRVTRSRSSTSRSRPWSPWSRPPTRRCRRCSRMSASNVFYTEAMNFGEPDAAFAQADRVVSAMIDSARVTHVPMEGRGGVADYHVGTDELTYHAGSQAPHALRQGLAGLLRASGRPPARGDPRHRRGVRAEGRARAARTSPSAPPPRCSVGR